MLSLVAESISETLVPVDKTMKSMESSNKSILNHNSYMNNLPLGETETFDENGNTCCSSKSRNNTSCSSVEEVNKRFQDLKINSLTNRSNRNKRESEQLAGTINKVITGLNTVLVQPVSPDNLLYFGTPLFLNSANLHKFKETGYLLLGYIEDIFGSIGEPMYSVNIVNKLTNQFNVGTDVYYFPDEFNTQLMYVEQTARNTFNVINYKL